MAFVSRVIKQLESPAVYTAVIQEGHKALAVAERVRELRHAMSPLTCINLESASSLVIHASAVRI